MRMTFELRDPIKPYVRMTQRGKWTSDDAQAYLASKTAIQYKIKEQMNEKGWNIAQEREKLAVLACYQPLPSKTHTHDADNVLKAILDAMNKIVYPDDRWIELAFISRMPLQGIPSNQCYCVVEVMSLAEHSITIIAAEIPTGPSRKEVLAKLN